MGVGVDRRHVRKQIIINIIPRGRRRDTVARTKYYYETARLSFAARFFDRARELMDQFDTLVHANAIYYYANIEARDASRT